MRLDKQRRTVLAITLILVTSFSVGAQQAAKPNAEPGGAEVTPLASSRSLLSLLPDKLAGIKATTDIKQLTRETVAELVGDKAAVYQEYRVTSAASRTYSGVRVDVFETQNQFTAFGLFMFNSGASRAKPIEQEEQVGSNGAQVGGELIFWKGNFFVRVSGANQKPTRGNSAVREGLARAVAAAIASNPVASRPPLLNSLPAASLIPQSQQYFLGSESLNACVEHGREMFEFAGDTEAVMGQYAQTELPNGAASPERAPDQTPANRGSAQGSASPTPDSTLKLLIVECHTPQFATDAMERVSNYVSSLPETEQQQIILKRTGNYVIEALNVRNREFAEGLINSVQYPYTVKWLRNPLWPTNDPFRMEKTANMLLSTFGLLGLILLTVLVVGSVFGTTIFLKRRKQQREVFSDAGGMLRLDIDQFESVLLGLPPKRDN
jgi:uncharacterized protein DUF6599